MNVVPSLVEGYMYAEMFHGESGDKQWVGGYPIDVVDTDILMGGGSAGNSELISKKALKHLVIPVGLIQWNPPFQSTMGEIERTDSESSVIDDSLFDQLFDCVSKRSAKPSKRKTLKIRKSI